jgi:hypothetical protein
MKITNVTERYVFCTLKKKTLRGLYFSFLGWTPKKRNFLEISCFEMLDVLF